MSFTRKSLADHLDSYDTEISQLQESKRLMLTDYRDQLAQAGMGKAQIKAEVDALKAAMRRRRAVAKKGNDEVDQADALADEIFVEITSRAPRAMRTHEGQQSSTRQGESDAEYDLHRSFEKSDLTQARRRQESGKEECQTFIQSNETPTGSAADEIPATNSQSAVTLSSADEPEVDPQAPLSASGNLSDDFVPAFLKREVA